MWWWRRCSTRIVQGSRGCPATVPGRTSGRRGLSGHFDDGLLNQIRTRLRFDGPMTVAEFMQEVLTHPVRGYYVTQDAFKDFTTSPEISQMFGECVGVWLLHEWSKMGAPAPLQLVELGPGRGTLIADVLRAFLQLSPEVAPHVSVHLVESSRFLREQQQKRLEAFTHRIRGIEWHPDLRDVPLTFSLYVANEFFDALPIHQFVRVPATNVGDCWRELLVDLDSQDNLRWIRARNRTPANVYLDKAASLYAGDDRQVVEVSPKTGLIVEQLCDRIVSCGGAALISDYGHDGHPDKGNTFRAFKNHQLYDPLREPGSADLTADVDFALVRRHCDSNLTLTYGPVSQGHFLQQLGIRLRFERLRRMNASKPDVVQQLEQGYRLLTHPDDMGDRFKFFCIFPRTMQPIHELSPPAGFACPATRSSFICLYMDK